MFQILAVDDAELMLALQRSFIQRSDCRLLTATRYDEAWERAESEGPDLVVLDGAPGGWGMKCCRAMRSSTTLCNTPIVLLGSAAPGTPDPCAEAGADAVVGRPLVRRELLGTLETMLRLAPALARGADRRSLTTRVHYTMGGEPTTSHASTRADAEAHAEAHAESKDLSRDGMFLKSREAFEPGDVLQLWFALPVGGSPVRATVEVVRTVKADRDSHLIPGIGVSFRTMDRRGRERISRYLGGGIE